MKKLLVFTDLDGSLLDHNDYSWQAARPALQALEENGFPVIYTSSKTSAEILELRQETGNQHPFISENGAVANIPGMYFSDTCIRGEYSSTPDSFLFGRAHAEIISLLNRLRHEHNYSFHGFYDMELDELIELTDLDRRQALNAVLRKATEPLLWKDTEEALISFKEHVENEGLLVTSGGRFLHVMSDVNKGNTVKWMAQRYQQAEPETDWVIVCIGDSVNDVPMLEVADRPVFILNPATKQPDVSFIANLVQTRLPGPAGWNEAMLAMVNELLQENYHE